MQWLLANRFVFSTNNLGNVTKSEVGWTVKNFTQWDPLPPYSFSTNGQKIAKQVSYVNTYAGVSDAHSALQASGLAWGAYMNSNDWENNGKPMTTTYGYKYDNNVAPVPFDSTLYGAKSALLIEADMAVTKYTGQKLSENLGSVGQAFSNIVFTDVATQKELTFIARMFDWRGFTIVSDAVKNLPYPARIGSGFWIEEVSPKVNGEVIIASHLGVGTKYCSMEENSDKSQTAPWTEKKHFAYRISRAQFAMIINNANLILPSGLKYSTNPNNYKLKSMDIRIEGSKLTPPSDTANKLEMSYIGENFKVSTISWTNLGTAVWGDSSTVSEDYAGIKKSIGTAYYPGAALQQFGLAIFNLGKATATPVVWQVKNWTGWDPLAPYISQVDGKQIIKQLSYTNNYNGPSERYCQMLWMTHKVAPQAAFRIPSTNSTC